MFSFGGSRYVVRLVLEGVGTLLDYFWREAVRCLISFGGMRYVVGLVLAGGGTLLD